MVKILLNLLLHLHHPLFFSYESSSKYESSKNHFKSPLLKLYLKFEIPMYDGELNHEKLDNWVKQIEVYCETN